MNVAVDQKPSAPTVAQLLDDIDGAPTVPVTGIASDSRAVQTGDLFIACQGLTHHGIEYIAAAESQGAVAVIWDASTATLPVQTRLPNIGVANLADRVGDIADRFFASPSHQLRVIGTTGTNGKTTVAWFVAQSLQLMQQRCAYIGTLGAGLDALSDESAMTTPAAIDLHAQLATFVDQGATAAAIEVSSHALTQGRVDGVRFEAAIFTNLTRDHLDYHGDMDSYFAAKSRLFLECKPRVRIVNVDGNFGQQLADLCEGNVIRVSTSPAQVLGEGDNRTGSKYLSVTHRETNAAGSRVVFASTWGRGEFQLNMPGDFNVANATAVLAYHLCNDTPLDTACAAMELLRSPPGRMQQVADTQPKVFVDYAHTPDALQVALQALRTHCEGAIWCVFGCGGERDQGKRATMGRIASELADNIVVTNDNPRSESATDIVQQITADLAAKDNVTVIEDRATAIDWCIQRAAASDTILIAGKGHENYQLLGDERIDFSDVGVAERALDARRGRS